MIPVWTFLRPGSTRAALNIDTEAQESDAVSNDFTIARIPLTPDKQVSILFWNLRVEFIDVLLNLVAR